MARPVNTDGINISDSTNRIFAKFEESAGLKARNPNEKNALKKSLERMKKEGLIDNNHVEAVQIVVDNLNYANRLITLFKTLKEFNIPLDNSRYSVINESVEKTSTAANLLSFMHNLHIDVKQITFEHLFRVYGSEEEFRYGIREIAHNGHVDINAVNLMLAFPKQASSLAIMINNFQERGYRLETHLNQLHAFNESELANAVDLINLALLNYVFYPDLINVLVRQKQDLEIIHEGAKKLAEEGLLTTNYFDVVEHNPGNGNVMAKIMLLLSSEQLIDTNKSQDISKVGQLSLGAFYLMKFLKRENMLTSETYETICQNSKLLANKEITEGFRSIKLFDSFDKSELQNLLNVMRNAQGTDSDVDQMLSVVNTHQYLAPFQPKGPR